MVQKWIERTDRKLTEVEEFIKSENDKAEIRARISTTLGIIGMIGGNKFL